MHDDDRQPLFFAELSLFTFAMLSLVTANNFVQLFFGWEGVGLASYLLIGFWYHRPSANSAAIKAFVVNRVGDFGFALGIFAIYYVFHDVNFDTVFEAARHANSPTLHGLRLSGRCADRDLPAAVHGRDGQVGAIPAAHLAARRDGRPHAGLGPHPCRDHGDGGRVHGGAAFAAVRAFALRAVGCHARWRHDRLFRGHRWRRAERHQARDRLFDLLAARLYVRRRSALRAYSAGIFHLFTHAFFKALLFLGAGSVIHALHGEQDLRRMGGLRNAIPFTFMMMLAGTLALTGFPYTAGYFSKDAIIEVAHASHAPGAEYAFWALIIAAFLTSFYSWRLVFMAFFGKPRDEHAFEHAHESPPVMTVPLLVLAIGAIGRGLRLRALLHRGPLRAILAHGAVHAARQHRSRRQPHRRIAAHEVAAHADDAGRLPARLYLLHRGAWASGLDGAQFQADPRLPL